MSERRVGLVLAYISALVGDVGAFSDGRYNLKESDSAFQRDLARLADELKRQTGNLCPRCNGYGEITWGGGSRQCVACDGEGKNSPCAMLAVAVADTMDAARDKDAAWWDSEHSLDVEDAIARGTVVFHERHQ